VDSFGNINIVWLASATVFDPVQGLVFARSTDNGATFSTPVAIYGSTAVAPGEQLIVDSKGNINVVWQSNASGKAQVFFSRSSDDGATFSFPQNISNDFGNATAPVVAMDSAGNLNIAWTDDTPGTSDIFFSRQATLASLSSTVASVPNTVTVPAGATTAIFIVNTISVPESTSITFSASYQGATRTVNLTVFP